MYMKRSDRRLLVASCCRTNCIAANVSYFRYIKNWESWVTKLFAVSFPPLLTHSSAGTVWSCLGKAGLQSIASLLIPLMAHTEKKTVNPVLKKFRFICLGKFLGQERKNKFFGGENISPQLVFLWGMFHLKLSTRSIQVSCYHRAYRPSLMLWWFGTREEGPAQRSLSSWAQCTRCMYFCRHCIHFTSSKSTSKHPLLIFS